jgi:dimethylargininase
MFSKAIVRPPGTNYADGLTSFALGLPDYERALRQHAAYCKALERCGLELIYLEPDERYPDSTFVEDTAVLMPTAAILTRPGAASRIGEVVSIKETLSHLYPRIDFIHEPGTVDGGDVCEAGNHLFIGLSERTNETGAEQLAELLASYGFASSLVDIRTMKDILHLKSGLAYLGDNRLAVIEALANREEFRGYELVRVNAEEEYAANCVRVNDYVLVAAGYPVFEQTLRGLGYETIALEMTEFQQMDGGLSCLSLRF